MSETYRDFRPIRIEDVGWVKEKSNRILATETLVKARRYFNPKTHEIISLRQYQNLRRGTTQSKFEKIQRSKGIPKKQYKPRKLKQARQVSKPRQQKPQAKTKAIKTLTKREREKQNQLIKDRYHERADFFQYAFLKRVSELIGYQISWDELDSRDKTLFWNIYHELIDYPSVPTNEEWDYYFQDFFDLEYNEIEDVQYGETP